MHQRQLRITILLGVQLPSLQHRVAQRPAGRADPQLGPLAIAVAGGDQALDEVRRLVGGAGRLESFAESDERWGHAQRNAREALLEVLEALLEVQLAQRCDHLRNPWRQR